MALFMVLDFVTGIMVGFAISCIVLSKKIDNIEDRLNNIEN